MGNGPSAPGGGGKNGGFSGSLKSRFPSSGPQPMPYEAAKTAAENRLKSFESFGEEAREELQPISMSNNDPRVQSPSPLPLNVRSLEVKGQGHGEFSRTAPGNPSPIAQFEECLAGGGGGGERGGGGNPKLRQRANTLGGKTPRKSSGATPEKIPTVFKWSSPSFAFDPTSVHIGGSFNDWEVVPMRGSNKSWVIIIDLPEGEHTYKFKVDDKWMHNPREKTVADGCGGFNNVITVRSSDYEVFEALDMDCKDVKASKRVTKESEGADEIELIPYGQEMPTFISLVDNKKKNPPILPPHLLQVMLNKDTPLSCEPTLLPLPNHVMLNHMYALSIRDNVMVMSTTQRFRTKYVTTVLYRPIGV